MIRKNIIDKNVKILKKKTYILLPTNSSCTHNVPYAY